MRQTTGTRKSPGEKIVKDIKRATHKQYSSEEKIRIVLDGLRVARTEVVRQNWPAC
jgi:transposase